MVEKLTRMTAEQSRAWISLITTAELLPAALDAQLQRDSRLTHYEYMLLGTLQRGGPHRLSDLAAATNATLPRTSKVVSRLRERGLVEREEVSEDRRSVSIRLTGEGRRQTVLATPGHFDTVHRLVLDHLTEDQTTTLADALAPIVDALDPHRRFGPQRE